MANLPTIALGNNSLAPEAGGVVGSNPLLEVIGSADDTDYAYIAHNPASGTADLVAYFEFDDMPTDFRTMDSISVRLRYLRASGTQNNTWTLRALLRIPGTPVTELTSVVDVATNITTTTATNSSVINLPLTDAGRTATRTDWNGAVLVIRWLITRVGVGDTLQKRVTAGELTGTYLGPEFPQIMTTIKN